MQLEHGIKIASIERCKPRIPPSKQSLLSDTDKNLLKLSFANKKNCILITDDQTLRKIAKLNSIKCYTTPEFIAFMQKKVLKSLPMSEVASQYIAEGVLEEIVLEYYQKRHSISNIKKLTGITITKIMDILKKLEEELEDLEADLEEIERFDLK